MDPPSLSPIERLPQELLSNIFSRLRREKIFPVLFTCRRFYHAAYPHYWDTIEYNQSIAQKCSCPLHLEPDLDTPSSRRFQATGLCRLAEAVRDVGVDKLGFRYVKRLVFGKPEFSERGPWVINGLLEIITKLLLEGGLIRLRDVTLMIDSHGAEPCAQFLEFFKALRENNSHPKNATAHHPPRICIIGSWHNHTSATLKPRLLTTIPLFPSECIKSLEFQTTFSTNLYTDNMDVVMGYNIRYLADVLSQTRNLERLCLVGMLSCGLPYPIRNVREEVYRLQAAITALESLVELVVWNLLFHPSLFITPPEKVKKLVLRQQVSFAWWRKFAECRFSEQLEELIMLPHPTVPRTFPTSSTKNWWSTSDDIYNTAGEGGRRDIEANLPDSHEFVFELGNLALKSLKRLEIDCDRYLPEDFFDLVLSRNPNLEPYYREKYTIMGEEWKTRVLQSEVNTPWGYFKVFYKPGTPGVV